MTFENFNINFQNAICLVLLLLGTLLVNLRKIVSETIGEWRIVSKDEKVKFYAGGYVLMLIIKNLIKLTINQKFIP